MSVALRPAISEDLELLTGYLRQLNASHGESRYTLEQMRARMAEIIRDGEAVVILSHGAPAGYAVIEDHATHAFIRHFLIVEGARRAGLGRAAFAALEAAHFPGRQVRLDASIKVPGPRAFWEAIGFRIHACAMRREPPEAPA